MRAIRVAPRNFPEINELSGEPLSKLHDIYKEDLKKGVTTLYYVEEDVFRSA